MTYNEFMNRVELYSSRLHRWSGVCEVWNRDRAIDGVKRASDNLVKLLIEFEEE